jgi:hypothetical protein
VVQRWEYYFVSAYLKGTDWYMPLSPTETLHSWPAITAFLNELGDQGWELVATTSIVYPYGEFTAGTGRIGYQVEYAFSFKRPKLEGSARP